MAIESSIETSSWPPDRKYLPFTNSVKRLARHAMVPLESLMAVKKIMTTDEIVNWLKGAWRDRRRTRRFERNIHQ